MIFSVENYLNMAIFASTSARCKIDNVNSKPKIYIFLCKRNRLVEINHVVLLSSTL